MSSLHPDASLLSPLQTPHWGDQSSSLFGAFTVSASNTIRAPAHDIISILLETANWPRWNHFVPSADSTANNPSGRLRSGDSFTEHVDMSGKGKASRVQKMWMKSEDEIVPTEDNKERGKGYRIVWVGKQFPDWLLRSERVHEIWEQESENGDKSCAYHDFETMSGPLAMIVKLFVGGQLVERFSQWNRELGEYAESHKDGAVARQRAA